MNHTEWIRKSFEYGRKGFERACDAAETLNGKAEEYTGKALEAPYVPEQGRELVKSWIEEGRRLRKETREAVLAGYGRIESLVIPA
jgi:hypothetical protein